MVIPILFLFQDSALLIARLALALVFTGSFERRHTESVVLFSVRALISLPIVLGAGVQAAALAVCIWSVISLVSGIIQRDAGAWQRAALLVALSAVLLSTGGGSIAILGGW